MKIALTGGSGFLGNALAQRLTRRGHAVCHLLRDSSQALPKAQVQRVDFSDLEALREAMKGCDLLLHAIGLTNGSDEALREANVTITNNLIQALPLSVKKVVYVSSAAAAMGKGLYGDLKREAEELVGRCQREWVIVRPTLIYGPGDTKNLQMMIDWICRSPVVPVLGGGLFKVQPVYIEDAARAIVEACLRRVSGEIFNLCGPEQISLKDMLVLLREKLDRRCLFVPIPLKPVQEVMRLWIKMFPKTKLPVKQILELDKHEAFEYASAAKELGFEPQPFPEALDWVR